MNVRRSCRLALLRPSVWYAKSEARDQSALRLRIREIAMDRPRFGYLRVLVMLKREGWKVGKKCPYCNRCVFLNPLEVESPYWKKTWLAPGASVCVVHNLPLVTLRASLARDTRNMLDLIKRVGRFERQRRELARSDDVGRRH